VMATMIENLFVLRKFSGVRFHSRITEWCPRVMGCFSFRDSFDVQFSEIAGDSSVTTSCRAFLPKYKMDNIYLFAISCIEWQIKTKGTTGKLG